jgi:flagellar biosynthesis anti-sigma factor FlgM
MKIYDLNLTGGAAAGGTARTQETQTTNPNAGNKAAGAGGASGDRVEFSTSLGRLSQALSAQASARSSRIQALAAQYQNGTYQPDAAATAKGLVSEAVSGASH